MAKEYLSVQQELRWMTKYCDELVEHLQQNRQQETAADLPPDGATTQRQSANEQSQLQKSVEEYVQLQNEKESLIQLHRSLKEQLNRYRVT